MTYRFIYEPDYSRIMFAVLVDNRASIPQITNQIGVVIKNYVDGQVSLINNNSIVYRIEYAEKGVLAGFFAIQVNTSNKTAILIMQQIRPAFQQYKDIISQQISNFIQTLVWHHDFLF